MSSLKLRPASNDEGMSHEDFMAVSGLAPVPSLGATNQSVAVRVPLVYEQACQALVACTQLDEARVWADKAEAMSAYAKMYSDDRAMIEARRLKLHAYRRMAELADALLPDWREKRPDASARGRLTSLVVLKAHGLTQGTAATIQKVGKLSQVKFDKAVNAEKPPTPGTLVHIDNAPSPGWARIKRAMSVVNTICKHHPPAKLAKSLGDADRARAKLMVVTLQEWLRKFENDL